MMKTVDATSYRTCDLSTAAFMLCGPGAHLADVHWIGRKAEFGIIFDEQTDVHARLADFRAGRATVVASEFVDALALLKRSLFAAPR